MTPAPTSPRVETLLVQARHNLRRHQSEQNTQRRLFRIDHLQESGPDHCGLAGELGRQLALLLDERRAQGVVVRPPVGVNGRVARPIRTEPAGLNLTKIEVSARLVPTCRQDDRTQIRIQGE